MTLKDIAQQAEVSISTVSRVINGNASKAASKEIQDKIWAIARAGGYTPNKFAQTLKQGPSGKKATKSIACIYARTSDVQNDAFFSTLTRSIEQTALKEGYIVKYSFSVFDIENPVAQNQILNNDVDGAAILGRCDKKTLKFLQEHFHKLVYTGLNILDVECDQVICDGSAITAEAIDFLVKQGHTCIGYIGDTKQEVRYKAYRESLRRHQLDFVQNITAHTTGSSEGGYLGAKRILSRANAVTAFFCMNDITAIGAIKAIQECGFSVPQDISVISMDDIEIAQYVFPMLTTVHIPIEDMGNIAAKTLIDRIENGHHLPMKISLPYQLIQRESCKRLSSVSLM